MPENPLVLFSAAPLAPTVKCCDPALCVETRPDLVEALKLRPCAPVLLALPPMELLPLPDFERLLRELLREVGDRTLFAVGAKYESDRLERALIEEVLDRSVRAVG